MAKITSTEKRNNKSAVPFLVPLYIFTFIIVFLPLLYIVAIAFAQKEGNIGIRWDFTLKNFMAINNDVYIKTFFDSFKLAFSTTGIAILVGYPFGYFMAKQSPKWRKIIMSLITVPFWTNSLIRMYGWMILMRRNGAINKFLQFTGIVDAPVDMLYTYEAVLVGMVYGLLPFMILSVYSSVEKMDWTLVEASRDLGASSFYAFLTVTLRLTLPGLISGSVLVFVPSMGLFFISDLLGGGKIMLVGNLIQAQFMTSNNKPFGAAISIVMILIVAAIVWIVRKITKTDNIEVTY